MAIAYISYKYYNMVMSVAVFSPEFRPRIVDAVNVANNDVKALAGVAMFYEGEKTVTALADAVAEHTGIPEVFSYVKGYPPTYRKADFATARTGVGENRRQANFYSASDVENLLPVIGTLFEWADQHERSLTATLSDSGSKSNNRGPFNTVQIIDGLLTGANVGELDHPGYKRNVYGGKSTHNTRLKKMVASGLVDVVDPNDEFEINDPTYGGTKPFSCLSPAYRQAYQVLSVANKLAPGKKWTVSSLMDTAVELQITQPDEARKLKKALTLAISVNTPKAFQGAVEKIRIGRRRYIINPSFVEAGQDLVERLRIVDTATDRKLTVLTDFAIESYIDQDRAAAIATRGMLNTFHGNKLLEKGFPSQRPVNNMLTELGWVRGVID